MLKTLYYASPVKGYEIDKNRKSYVDGKVNSAAILSDHNKLMSKFYI